jgi:hypothetical protein
MFLVVSWQNKAIRNTIREIIFSKNLNVKIKRNNYWILVLLSWTSISKSYNSIFNTIYKIITRSKFSKSLKFLETKNWSIAIWATCVKILFFSFFSFRWVNYIFHKVFVNTNHIKFQLRMSPWWIFVQNKT